MGHKYRLCVILAAAAVVFHLFEGFGFINSAAPVYPETVHLASGYSYLATGLYRMNVMENPPLSELLSALPLLLLKPQSFSGHPYFANLQAYNYGDLFLYNNTSSAGRLLNTARRFTFVVWTALLAALVWLFASRLESAEAAGLSIAVFALLPVFISNDALVTPDAAAAVFYFGAFALAWRFTDVKPEEAKGGKKPQPAPAGKLRLWACLAGIAAGLGMVSRFSLFIVPPMIAAFWIADNLRWPRMKFSKLAGCIFLFAAACLLTVLLVYKFDLKLYFDGLSAALGRPYAGRSSFVMGRHALQGLWWYFPSVLAVKTPLLALLGAAAGLVLVFKGFRRGYLWLLIPPAAYFAASLASRAQAGYGQIMPVLPFLAVLAGIALARLLEVRRGAWLVCGLLAFTAVSVSRAHPYYLAYFNELAGGPANGYKLFVDTSLDWGQDVKGVAEYLRARGNPPVILSYFGVARPESYGLNYVPLLTYSSIELGGTGARVCAMRDVLLAVSATNLQGTYYSDRDTFAWLKARKPAHTAGYSIFVYDLTADKDGLGKLAALFDREGRNAEADCLYARAGK